MSYSGPFIAGVVFEVTTGGCWLDGYWWWVCPSGQPTAAQKFALWCVTGPPNGTLVASSTVTSGALTAGQWNYVPLPAPVPLAIGATYVVATGVNGSFPDTNSQFGSGGPYSNGIVNGPLTAFSDGSGTRPSLFSTDQGVFSVAGSDPTTSMPIYGSGSSNFWMDLQVDITPPTGTSYRLWPNYPTIPGHINSDTSGYTLGTEFQLSASCKLDAIWYYSPPGAAALPTRCAIWNVGTQSGGLGHRQHGALLVGSGRVRLGLLRVQRRHASRGRLQGVGVLRRRVAVVPGHHELLGRWRPGQQRHHHRAGHRAQPGRRHQPWAEHV